jgi:hypothetical protein
MMISEALRIYDLKDREFVGQTAIFNRTQTAAVELGSKGAETHL